MHNKIIVTTHTPSNKKPYGEVITVADAFTRQQNDEQLTLRPHASMRRTSSNRCTPALRAIVVIEQSNLVPKITNITQWGPHQYRLEFEAYKGTYTVFSDYKLVIQD